MKTNTNHTVDAPIGDVFDWLTDVESIAAVLERRHITVTRSDDAGPMTAQTQLQVVALIQGKTSKIEITVAQIDPPHRLVLTAKVGAFRAELTADLSQGTDVAVGAVVTAQSIAARMMLKAGALAQPRVVAAQQEIIDQYLAAQQAGSAGV